MRATTQRNLGLLSVGLAVLLVAPASAEVERSFRFDADQLEVSNLVGRVRLEGYEGDDYQVVVTVRGADASADRLRFDTEKGREARLDIVFPLEQERHYVYPELGGSSRRIRPGRGERSWLQEIVASLTDRDVTVRGRGPGLELWADVVVKVPRGREISVHHGVGDIEVADLRSNGKLKVLAGGVAIDRAEGDLSVSTGSGRVTASAVQGDLLIDTGSGGVRGSDLLGDKVSIDTGSGSVDLEHVTAGKLLVDTGSGSVSAQAIDADSVSVDTGSGSVLLALERLGTGHFDVDTGSGAITLLLPESASADFAADTGSGGIDLDLRDAQVLHREHDEIRFRLGSGSASVRLDAGSGGIRVARLER